MSLPALINYASFLHPATHYATTWRSPSLHSAFINSSLLAERFMPRWKVPTSDTSLSKVSTMLRAVVANGCCSHWSSVANAGRSTTWSLGLGAKVAVLLHDFLFSRPTRTMPPTRRGDIAH